MQEESVKKLKEIRPTGKGLFLQLLFLWIVPLFLSVFLFSQSENSQRFLELLVSDTYILIATVNLIHGLFWLGRIGADWGLRYRLTVAIHRICQDDNE